MSRKQNSNFFIKLSVIFFLIVIMCAIAAMQLKYNELRVARDKLVNEIEIKKAQVEKLSDELDMPFDDDYVVKIARERLNLCRPEEILFYNDLLK